MLNDAWPVRQPHHWRYVESLLPSTSHWLPTPCAPSLTDACLWYLVLVPRISYHVYFVLCLTKSVIFAQHVIDLLIGCHIFAV